MSRERQIGTKYENRVRDYFLERGHLVKRTEFSSPNGDLDGLPEFVLECKCQKEQRLGLWIDQAKRAAARLGRLPVVIHNRRMKPIEESYVSMTLATFCDLYERLRGTA